MGHFKDKMDDTVPPQYRACADAFAYCELVLNSTCEDYPQTAFAILREKKAGLGVDDLSRWVLRLMDGALMAEGNDEVQAASLNRAKAQVATPEFRRYLAGILGFM